MGAYAEYLWIPEDGMVALSGPYPPDRAAQGLRDDVGLIKAKVQVLWTGPPARQRRQPAYDRPGEAYSGNS